MSRINIASKPISSNPILWIFNLGVKSGLPKYFALLGFIQISPLLIPESVWDLLGFNISNSLLNLPHFIQHYINVTTFKRAMFVFWIMSPFTLLTSTCLCLIHINNYGYSAYLVRREARLRKAGKSSDYSLLFGCAIFILLYLWATGINLKEPSVFSGYAPFESRFTMIIIHGGSISLVLPLFMTFIITEIRANLTKTKI